MKKVALIPPIIADLVYQAISGVSGVRFMDAAFCPGCGGSLISHDLKKRRFSTVHTPDGQQQIFVYIKRFHCRECGKLCYADAPFYEKSRFGSPVVDLCVSLSRTYSYYQVALILESLGIIVDRGTVRKTALGFSHDVEMADLFGIVLPRSVLALSALVMSADTMQPITGREVLEACGFLISS